MLNKEYHEKTEDAFLAFTEYCNRNECERCPLLLRKNNVFGCFGFWLNSKANIVLRPCPHCGGKAELHIDASGSFVECKRCSCETPHYEDTKLVVETWNCRANVPSAAVRQLIRHPSA